MKDQDTLAVLVAGYLSTIEFTPAHHHPATMIPIAEHVVALVQNYDELTGEAKGGPSLQTLADCLKRFGW